MCFGVSADTYSITVEGGFASLSQNDEVKLLIPVTTLAKLYRRGMKQHKAEKPREASIRSVVATDAWAGGVHIGDSEFVR